MPNEVEIEKLIRRFGEMRAAAARAVQAHPNDERALFGAAMASRISGDYGSARTHFESLRRLNPSNTHYLFELGLTQEYMGLFDEAVANYEASLQAEPMNY